MSNNTVKNILIVGVGGQGIVLSSEIMAKVCMSAGYDVKQNEVHGMAQRGGSVSSHVRYGKQVFSPLIEQGKADVLLAFEQLEALRWSHHLAPTGVAIVNTQKLEPVTVTSGAAKYPDDIPEKLKAACPNLQLINGIGIATQAGNIRAVNMALLGALSARLEFPAETWTDCIEKRVPPRTIEINLKAFNEGRRVATA